MKAKNKKDDTTINKMTMKEKQKITTKEGARQRLSIKK
jgi:hypothetical protein